MNFDNVSILVPTDLSEQSNKAFRDATEIAELFNGTITPLYVLREDDDYKSMLGESAGSKIKEFVRLKENEIKEIAGGVVPSYMLKDPVVDYGDVLDTINHNAIRHDLVVMTTQGKSAMSRLMVGSMAKKVVSSCSIPVIVVDANSVIKPLNRILLTTDFSEKSEAVFPYAKKIAEKTGARIDLVHIYTVGYLTVGNDITGLENAETKVKELKEKYFSDIKDQVSGEVKISSVSVSEAITNLVFSRDYSLVCMSTLGRSSLGNMIIGSTSAAVVRLIDTAVLTFNPNATLDA